MTPRTLPTLLLALLAAVLLAAGPAGAYELYFGDLHSHTSFSDGEGLPEDAYDMARYDAGTDFWSVTDHVEQLHYREDLPPGAPRQWEWDAMMQAALEKNEDGKFVALAGFEWAMDQSQGHINIINSSEITRFEEAFTLKRFYRWVYRHPEALIGFNHPSSDSDTKKLWNDFQLVPPIASQVFFVATNKPEDFEFYYRALDRGWRVGPSAHQDNHSRSWGLHENGNFTAVYADELTRSAIIGAFRERRFYATNDRGLRLWLAGNGEAMGSRLEADAVELEIKCAHDGGAGIRAVKLVSNGGGVVREWLPGEGEFEAAAGFPAAPEGARWYVVLAETAGGRFAISAPVWVEKARAE